MKNLRLVLGLVSLVTSFFTLNSCKKSYRCCYSYNGVQQCETIERSSFPSESAFKAYINSLKAQGVSCK